MKPVEDEASPVENPPSSETTTVETPSAVETPVQPETTMPETPEETPAKVNRVPKIPMLEENNVRKGFVEHDEYLALMEKLPGLSVSISSEVSPQMREYERFNTVVANAYIKPMMESYLGRLRAQLKQEGADCPIFLMHSGGGIISIESAAQFPVRLVESGPAGGAVFAAHIAARYGLDKVLSFDMGGTTAKICLIDDFEPQSARTFEVDRAHRFTRGSGLPLRIPVIEMVEIGAGGGSVAQVDKLGRIQVGPESAGSEPGPAAYGRGGDRPTVTDADVLLGRVCAERFAGGVFELDPNAARAALRETVAEPLGLDDELAAFGVSEVVDENMAAAARAHAAEFGLDLGARDMVAFGGAAPLHAARLGEKLGVNRVVIPAQAGVGSAVGFLLAPVAYEVVRSRRQALSALDHEQVNRLMQEMHAESLAVVRLGTTDELQETRHAYMRYVGQGHEIVVPLPVEAYGAQHAGVFRGAFEAAYRHLYGRVIEGIDIEVLSWTLTLAAAAPDPRNSFPEAESRSGRADPDSQDLFDPATGRRVMAAVRAREALGPDDRVDGPALIVEDQTTTVVPPAWVAAISLHGHIILERTA